MGACAAAAYNGHLAALQWLRRGLPVGRGDVGGQRRMVSSRRSSGPAPTAPVDSSVCTYAAYGGSLEVLMWAHQRLPVGRARAPAAENGVEVLM